MCRRLVSAVTGVEAESASGDDSQDGFERRGGGAAAAGSGSVGGAWATAVVAMTAL